MEICAEPRTEGTTALRSRSFLLLLVATLGGFGGYVLLLPVVPLWAVRGGAGDLAAGATNGVFMLVTVLTQLGMPWLLRRIDHRLALGLGTALIGAPTPLFAFSRDMVVLLGTSGLRGIGFGLLTVAGGAMVAELVPARLRGRAAGLYGLSVGLPNVALLPVGIWLTQTTGFPALFWIAGVVPLVATTAVLGIAPVRTARAPAATTTAFPRTLLAPWTVMLSVATAAGGLIAFLPLAVDGAAAPLALMAFGVATTLGRWLAGHLTDRLGPRRVLLPGALLATAGPALLALATPGPASLAVAGALLFGAGFGAVQNVTLVVMFERTASGAASTAWNIAYDAGNGLGSAGFGLLITTTGYATTFAAAATLVLVCAPLAATAGARRK